jgi:hypothetical protein
METGTDQRIELPLCKNERNSGGVCHNGEQTGLGGANGLPWKECIDQFLHGFSPRFSPFFPLSAIAWIRIPV